MTAKADDQPPLVMFTIIWFLGDAHGCAMATAVTCGRPIAAINYGSNRFVLCSRLAERAHAIAYAAADR
jgi:hypothetical protein